MGYTGMGLDERYRQGRARDQWQGINARKASAGRQAERDALNEKVKTAQAVGGAGISLFRTFAGGAG